MLADWFAIYNFQGKYMQGIAVGARFYKLLKCSRIGLEIYYFYLKSKETKKQSGALKRSHFHMFLDD